MEEWNTTTPIPYTVTVRRNPPRRARPTPYSTVPYPTTPSTQLPSNSHQIPSFPIDDILDIKIPPPEFNPDVIAAQQSSRQQPISENLKVFLRIRPLITQHASGKLTKSGASRSKNAWPQNPSTKGALKTKAAKKSEICLKVNDSNSVTLSPPECLKELKRIKSEVYNGFSHVFSADSSQGEVYRQMVDPLVEDFMKGKSGMLAALGPSGSGKTHTVFGSQRLPGMVPLALRHIFSSCETHPSRTFYLSMFEIYAEGGKSERIIDLCQGGGDPCLQQSTIKGLKETVVSDAQQADSLIALGMAKRNTAMTNSNSQSSRSQCIINIRSFCINLEGEVNGAVLTIVDLAGAEREKKTGNQGARLLESNKINNTSMVFGLCLRSLLEHQKNPKRPLQKHFQNSLLTKYLREYLEGKKRMALILTVKPGEEDYLDTSYLLRQASPYMQIKCGNDENKRQVQTFPRGENPKRMKLSSSKACEASEPNGEDLCQLPGAEDRLDQVKEIKQTKKLAQSAKRTTKTKKNTASRISDDDLTKKERQNQIMQGFAKALWKVLKEYKNNLEAAEIEKECLRNSLSREQARCSELEEELNLLKSCHGDEAVVVEENSIVDEEVADDSKNYQFTDMLKDQSPGNVLEALDDMKCLREEATCLNGELIGSEVLESPTMSAHGVMIDTTPFSIERSEIQNEEEMGNGSPHHVEDLPEIADAQTENTGQPRVLYRVSGVLESAECGVISRDDSSSFVDDEPKRYHYTDMDSPKDLSPGNVLESLEDMKDLGEEATCFSGELTGSEVLESPTRSSHVVMISSDTTPVSTERNLVQNEEEMDNGSPHHAEDLQEIADAEAESTGLPQVSGVLESAECGVISRDDGSSFVDSKPKRCHYTDMDSTTDQSPGNALEALEDTEDLGEEATCLSGEVTGAEVLESPTRSSHVVMISSETTPVSTERNLVENEEETDNGSPHHAEDLQEIVEFVDTQTENTGHPQGSGVSESAECGVISRDDSSFSVEEKNLENQKLSEAVVKSKKDVTTNELVCTAKKEPEADPQSKPKRRLLPASSLLLRNLNSFDFEEENANRTGHRGEKKDLSKKTKGSITLMRLLDDLHL